MASPTPTRPKVIRTYGKALKAVHDPQSDEPPLSSGNSLSFAHISASKTRSNVPTSPASNGDDSDDSDPSGLVDPFGIRKRLQDIDEKIDNGEEIPDLPSSNRPRTTSPSPSPFPQSPQAPLTRRKRIRAVPSDELRSTSDEDNIATLAAKDVSRRPETVLPRSQSPPTLDGSPRKPHSRTLKSTERVDTDVDSAISSLSRKSPSSHFSSQHEASELDDTELDEVMEKKKSNRKAGKASTAKKPTKKEIREANMETNRIRANAQVPSLKGDRPRRSIISFLASIPTAPGIRTHSTHSDPIEQFSSPLETMSAGPSTLRNTKSIPSPSPLARKSALASNDSEDELPLESGEALINKARADRLKAEALKKLLKRPSKQSDDDDLDIIEVTHVQRAPKSYGSTAGSSRTSPSRDPLRRPSVPKRHSDIGPLRLAKPAPIKKQSLKPPTQEDINARLLRQAEEKNKASQAKKLADYVSRGGKERNANTTTGRTLEEIQKQALVDQTLSAALDAGSDDNDDGEYRPPNDMELDENDLERVPSTIMHPFTTQETLVSRQSSPMFQRAESDRSASSSPPETSSDEEEIALAGNSRRHPRHTGTLRRIDSDEDDENVPPPHSNVTVHERAPGSDAENSPPPSDQSDAENVVPRQVVHEDPENKDERGPLVPRTSFPSLVSPTDSFASIAPPLFGGNNPRRASSSSSGPLSEISRRESASDEAEGGFSQFFEPTQSVDSKIRARDQNDFDVPLSLPSQRLGARVLPAPQMFNRRDANILFEQENEIAAQRSSPSPVAMAKRPLYVNEAGFFTQTNPDDKEKDIPVFSQHDHVDDDDGSQSPTEAIFSQVHKASSATPDKSRRLQRGRRQQVVAFASPFPVPRPSVTLGTSPKQTSPGKVVRRNAFELLGKTPKQLALTSKVDREEVVAFMADQAEESDDDQPFGFAGKHDDEEDAEDVDDDINLQVKNLVDDAEVDEQRNLVLEKVQEHAAEDDAQIQKRVEGVTRGDYRTRKRKSGFNGLDDDESSEDEDVRPRPKQRRRIENDGLEALAHDPESAAFMKAYQEGLKSDEEDDDQPMGFTGDEPMEEDENHSGESEGDDEQPEVISTAQLHDELRKLGKQAAHHSNSSPLGRFDPHDVSWMTEMQGDSDGDEEIIVASKSRPALTLDDDPEDRFHTHRRELSPDTRKRLEAQKAHDAQYGFGGPGGKGASVVGKPKRSTKPSLAKHAEGSTSQRPVRRQESRLSGLMSTKSRAFED